MDDFFCSNYHMNFPQVFQPEQVDAAARQLTYDNPVAFIDLNLSYEDGKHLNAFHLDPDSLTLQKGVLYAGVSNFFGLDEVLDVKSNELANYLNLLAPQNNLNTINHVSNVIRNLAKDIAVNVNRPCTSVEIEILPRVDGKEGWHRDNNSKDEKCELIPQHYQYNFLTTLKGPSTLYYVTNSGMNLKLAQLAQSDYFAFPTMGKIEELLFNSSIPYDIISAPAGYGSVHLIHPDIGALHSTPKFYHEQRLLVIFSVEHDHSCKGARLASVASVAKPKN